MLRTLAYLLLRASQWSSRHAGLVLVYHRVDERTGNPRRELAPPHGVRLFENQLRLVSRSYRVVCASDLPAAVMGRKRGQRFPVAITFDDDLASHRRLALPVLLRLGLPATFFVGGSSLDHAVAPWWESLQRVVDLGIDPVVAAPTLAAALPARRVAQDSRIQDLAETIKKLTPRTRDTVAEQMHRCVGDHGWDAGLPADDLRALADAGFEIGFHTRRHDLLPALANNALDRAVQDGRTRLAKLSGRPLTTIAYPHGAADARVTEAARRAGYRLGFTTDGSAFVPNTDPLLIGRIDPPFSVWRLALRLVRTLHRSG